jgi:hypothetical protein
MSHVSKPTPKRRREDHEDRELYRIGPSQKRYEDVSTRDHVRQTFGNLYHSGVNIFHKADATKSASKLPDIGALEPELVLMEKFLVNNECREWLESRVKAQTRATSWPIFCMECIAQAFYDMPFLDNNWGYFQARFVVSWHPRSFLRSQFAYNNQRKLGNIITLTGNNGIYQACTCSEYIRMMWPMTGDGLLQVLEEDLQMDSEEETSRKHKFHLQRAFRKTD